MTKKVVWTGYAPRPQFIDFHKRKQRWAIGVCHRRAGKTVACINDLEDAALRCALPEGRFAYVAPTFVQAKDIAWSYLKRFSAPIDGCAFHESELRVDYPNGARVRLYGGDNYDRMRGLYFDGVVLDEYGDMDPRAWSEVIRPALSDRKGWAVFIGTPRGNNHFRELWDQAGDNDWFRLELKASQTGILPVEELVDARKTMTEDQYEQEYECSFSAALVGAYYGKEMRRAEEDKRIVRVPYEARVPVHTAWDLGVDDATAIWFFQCVGQEVRMIDYYENAGEGLQHYTNVLRSKGYSYGDHIWPHDAGAKELGTGLSRVEVFASLGMRGRVLPRQEVEDGINAVRTLLSRCWFDAEKCKRGIEALKNYQREYDDKLRTFRTRPRHDWASHGADAFRYLALGLPKEQKPWKKPETKWVI